MTFYVYFLSKVGDKIYDLAAWAGSNSGMLEALSSSMNVVCVSSTQSNELTGVTTHWASSFVPQTSTVC